MKAQPLAAPQLYGRRAGRATLNLAGRAEPAPCGRTARPGFQLCAQRLCYHSRVRERCVDPTVWSGRMHCAGRSPTVSAPRATQSRPLSRHGLAARHRQRPAARCPPWHEGALHASARLHLQPTYQSPAFDSLQHGAARRIGAITTIEDDLTASSAAVCGTFLDDSVPLWLLPLLLPVAARRPGAARRQQRRLWRRIRAAAIFGWEWPRPQTAIPERASRYLLPLSSHNQAPSPLTKVAALAP